MLLMPGPVEKCESRKTNAGFNHAAASATGPLGCISM
jgi:hypothetical protein